MQITKRSVIFWPVGTGDSTTLVLKPGEVVMQIDLRHLAKADDASNPEWPIIDHLIPLLPKRNGRPYLALFVLTHPDKDHIQGFRELMARVDIGELWHTPKIFRDQSNEETLCDDAKAFRKEAHRRRKAIAENPGNIKSGDRLRVIGHDDILMEKDYQTLPASCKSRPGETVELVDGSNLAGVFRAFIHAPFKDDQAKDKNNTSLALNVVLWQGEQYAQFMFFGDRENPTITRIFETTEQNQQNRCYLSWNVMLCAHHCSKAVMYWKGEEDASERFKKNIMDYFAKYSRDGYIVASACSDFTDGEGDNPPHAKARNRYQEIVTAGHFICTHEFPNTTNPQPVVFALGVGGLELVKPAPVQESYASLTAATYAARGGQAPPTERVGFGRWQ